MEKSNEEDSFDIEKLLAFFAINNISKYNDLSSPEGETVIRVSRKFLQQTIFKMASKQVNLF